MSVSTVKEFFQGDFDLSQAQSSVVSFDTLKQAWTKVKQEKSSELLRRSPDLANPQDIYLKRLQETPAEMVVQFAGFKSAVDDSKSIPQAKRVILIWLRNVYMNVQQMKGNPDELIVKIDKEAKGDFDKPPVEEAAVSIFKRDPKSNKRKDYYRCVGGKKNGRRVSSPDGCIGVPDPMKKIKFGITKRAKPGQAKLGKKKTQLTNIVAKKIRKANQRVKKARGF